MKQNNKNLNKFINFILTPPLAFAVFVWGFGILVVAGAITLVCISYYGIISYFVYAFAFLLLAYSVYLIVKQLPHLKQAIVKQCQKFEFTKSLLESYGYRTFIFTILSVTLNLAFVAFNVVFSILTNYAWYGALAVYYLSLSSFRLCIFYFENKTNKKYADNEKAKTIQQLKNMRAYGIILLLLEVSMSAVITMMILSKNPNVYTKILAIVYAAYTVYKITFAILNAIKAYKTHNLQLQAFRNIGLADASISLISLQIILVTTFSNGDNSLLWLNAIVGFCACVFTIILGITMIASSSKKIKKLI